MDVGDNQRLCIVEKLPEHAGGLGEIIPSDFKCLRIRGYGEGHRDSFFTVHVF